MIFIAELTSGIGFSDIPGSDGAMKACRALVGHFSHSSQAAKRLLGKQVHLRHPNRPVGVLQDVSTRWWSTFSMTDRLLKLKTYFDQMEVEGWLTCNLSARQWVTVELVRNILKPFMAAQKCLEGEKYVTISFIPGIVLGMRTKLVAVIYDEEAPQCMRDLCDKMLQDFVTRWGSGDEDTVFIENDTTGRYNRLKGLSKLTMMAAALDPRTKLLLGIPNEDQHLLWSYIRDAMIKIVDENAVVVHPIAVAPAAMEPIPDVAIDEDDFYAILIGHGKKFHNRATNRGADEISVGDTVELEMSYFKSLPFLPGKISLADDRTEFPDPLLWWKVQADRLPILSKLARRVLCIPATSAPSERVFSTAGLTVANARAALNSENAAALIFLHDSWPEVERLENNETFERSKR